MRRIALIRRLRPPRKPVRANLLAIQIDVDLGSQASKWRLGTRLNSRCRSAMPKGCLPGRLLETHPSLTFPTRQVERRKRGMIARVVAVVAPIPDARQSGVPLRSRQIADPQADEHIVRDVNGFRTPCGGGCRPTPTRRSSRVRHAPRLRSSHLRDRAVAIEASTSVKLWSWSRSTT